MSTLNSSEEKRLHEYQKTRAMCAGIILHALRDFTEGDDEARRWLMETYYDDLETTTKLTTFPQACAMLDIDPDVIRSKIKSLNNSEILELGARLRRKKLPSDEEADEEPEEEEWDDFFPE